MQVAKAYLHAAEGLQLARWHAVSARTRLPRCLRHLKEAQPGCTLPQQVRCCWTQSGPWPDVACRSPSLRRICSQRCQRSKCAWGLSLGHFGDRLLLHRSRQVAEGGVELVKARLCAGLPGSKIEQNCCGGMTRNCKP